MFLVFFAAIVLPAEIHFLFLSLVSGITVDKYGVIFFVDGTMIRRIDQNGIISTLLGFNDLTSARPLSCDSVMDISQVGLSSCLPSAAFSPILPFIKASAWQDL